MAFVALVKSYPLIQFMSLRAKYKSSGGDIEVGMNVVVIFLFGWGSKNYVKNIILDALKNFGCFRRVFQSCTKRFQSYTTQGEK